MQRSNMSARGDKKNLWFFHMETTITEYRMYGQGSTAMSSQSTNGSQETPELGIYLAPS